MRPIIRFCLLVTLTLGVPHSMLRADPGKPVAVRWWGDAAVSVESYWNLGVEIQPAPASSPHAVDVVIGPKSAPDAPPQPFHIPGFDEKKPLQASDYVLDRFPGAPAPTCALAVSARDPSPHAIRVRTVPYKTRSAADDGSQGLVLIEVDGVRVVYLSTADPTSWSTTLPNDVGAVDVLCFPFPEKGAPWEQLVARFQPRYVVPIGWAPTNPPSNPPSDHALAVPEGLPVDRATGNTLAVRSADGDDDRSPRVVLLQTQPWELPAPLDALFERMETACLASQNVFQPLSAKQLNWRPPNGTHTPRWNAEHMMGRQLGFFSQIYAAVDPEISTIDLNPAQMPPDYRPAHPNWDGGEEARQMERSAAFVRRYAYLLKDVPLDQRAPGSRWTLRGLLEQMERHYQQHTANVEKKFALEGWPAGT